MTRQNKLRPSLALTIILLVCFSSSFSPVTLIAKGQSKKKSSKGTPKANSKSNKKSKKEQALQNGTPVLWQQPKDIASRNLLLGPGGAALKPDLSKVTFLEEAKGGHSKKFRVRDGAGREWIAKVGDEAQSETAAVRLVWAVGYVSEINYLVPHVQIEGKGSFDNVRFEARDKKRLEKWKWHSNPFVGTREFQGLKVLMLLLNNWDIKDINNEILLVKDSTGGNDKLWYIISDLGATFGKTGNILPLFWRLTRSRNDPNGYAHSKFVTKVENQRVNFRYNGKDRELFKDITVEQATWIGSLLAQLSDRQIGDAFRAANYTPVEVQTLTQAVRRRITELVTLSERRRRVR